MSTPVHFSVGLEQGPSGATLAHALNLPGCVAFGASPERATEAFPAVLSAWLAFLGEIGEPVPPRDAELEIAVDEWIATDAEVREGASTVCFAADLPPLSDREIERGLHRLGEVRGLLLRSVRRLSPEEVDRPRGPWTVRQALEELAHAQWWTLSRLGASPLAAPPDRTLGRLDTALALVVQHFGHLSLEARGVQLEIDGEEWTPRKVLRRLLWLEWSLGRAIREVLSRTTEVA